MTRRTVSFFRRSPDPPDPGAARTGSICRPEERHLLRRLLPQVRELLLADAADDRRTRRLYATAFPDDDEAKAEYQRFMHEELVASRIAAVDAVEASIDAKELDEQQLMSWMDAVNNVRLVLGTMLDVSEELEIGVLPDDDPDIHSYALYAYLPASSARSWTPSILAECWRNRVGCLLLSPRSQQEPSQPTPLAPIV